MTVVMRTVPMPNCGGTLRFLGEASMIEARRAVSCYRLQSIPCVPIPQYGRRTTPGGRCSRKALMKTCNAAY
jgi:hypothetical protein